MQQRVTEQAEPGKVAAQQKSAAELASEAKIRFYTRIFLVLVAIMGAWKAYALLAPKYL